MTEPTLREILERHCKRYALGHREDAINDLEAFVRASIVGCRHPGLCEPENRSRCCACPCSVCRPPAPPVMCTLCSYPEVAHGRNVFACGRFTPPEMPDPPAAPLAPP